jgi:hypothetical protein
MCVLQSSVVLDVISCTSAKFPWHSGEKYYLTVRVHASSWPSGPLLAVAWLGTSCSRNMRQYISKRILHGDTSKYSTFHWHFCENLKFITWIVFLTYWEGPKWRRGRFSPSTSVSPAIHSTSILTITRGRYNRPVSGRRAEWTQFGLHAPLCKLKNKLLRRPKTLHGPALNKESFDHVS